MGNNHIIKRIFKNRMNKENERKPRYATRKLSIGMVSCMLGFALLVSPLTSFAEEMKVEEKVQIDLSDLEDKDPEKLAIDTDNLIDTDAIDEFIMTEEKRSEPVIRESQLDSFEVKEEKYETLKERKSRDKVSKTIMAKDVTVSEDDFKNIQASNARKTSVDTADYYVTEQGVGSGYYDVNKLFDSKDGLLCSGATATNMMHWWLKQNKENVEKYLAESPDNGVIRAEGKERKIQELDNIYGDNNDQSKFFDFIKSAFNGKPISAEQLLNMYINGYGYGITWEKAKNKERKNESGINFFKKVFDTNILTDYHYVTTHEDFSKTIKEALESDKVMGISYAADKYHGMGHIVTLWGADFDENDKVVGIYVTDSDDGEARLKDNKKVGMIRYGINMHGNLLRINGHKDATSGAQIRHLYSLSTGKSLWEEYFKKNNNSQTAQHVESLPLGASEETLKRIQQQENSRNILSQNLSTNIEKPVEKVITKEEVKTPEVKKEITSPKVEVTKPKAETKKVESKVSTAQKKVEKAQTPTTTKTTKVAKKVESKVSTTPKKVEKTKTPTTKTTKVAKKVDSKVSATPKKVETVKTPATKTIKTKTTTKPSVKKVTKKETQDKNKKVQTTKEKVNVKKTSVTNTAKKVTKNVTKTPTTKGNKTTTKKVETKKTSTTLPTSKKVKSTVKSVVKKPAIMPRSAKVESTKTIKASAKKTSSKKSTIKTSTKTTPSKKVIISKKSR